MRLITLADLIYRIRQKHTCSHGKAIEKLSEKMNLSLPTVYRYTKMEPPVLVAVDKIKGTVTLYKECGVCNSML